MIGLEQLRGQRAAVEALRKMLATDNIPHALLFVGPEGVGKRTAARAFGASLILGREWTADDAFDAASDHPDLLTVGREVKDRTPQSRRDDPAEEDLKKFITVDQVRRVCSVAGQRPRSGKRRAFIIDPADRMNHEAQNALLKTLEEPPPSTILILVASRAHAMLPTVASRCFRLRFNALRTDELAELLVEQGLDREEALERAALSEGRPGHAIELDLDELRERREELLGFLEQLATRPTAAAELPGVAAALAGKDDATLHGSLDLFQTLLRDACRAALDPGADLIHRDQADRLALLGKRLGRERATGLIRSIDRARAAGRINLNRTLVAEALLAAVAGGPLP